MKHSAWHVNLPRDHVLRSTNPPPEKQVMDRAFTHRFDGGDGTAASKQLPRRPGNPTWLCRS